LNVENLYIVLLIIPIAIALFKLGKGVLTLNRILICLLLLVAISSPYYLVEKWVEGEAKATILVDNSTSMEIYDLGFLSEMPKDMIDYFGYENKSDIGDALFNHIEHNSNVLLITDGRNNYGRDLIGVASLAASMNVSVSTVKLDVVKDDVSVSIKGNRRVFLNSNETYDVVVRKVGKDISYKLTVFIDDTEVLNQKITQKEDVKVFKINHKFKSMGNHKIIARVDTDDFFKLNNVFYKSVYVLDKPKILFVGRNSPLTRFLSSLYDVDVVSSLPNRLDEYNAVILDDLPINKLSGRVGLLESYLEEGNGLVVVGGRNSFDNDYYKDTLFETLLPVKVVERGFKKSISLLIIIDISGSTGEEFGNYTKADVEKAIALSLVENVSKKYPVGIIAFNYEAYLVAPLSIYENKEVLKGKIASLKFGGATIMYYSQVMAESILDNVTGSKAVIIISDGITQLKEESIKKAREMAEKGIRTYTVGVGYDTDREFLYKLAKAGNGIFFPVEENQKLRALFGEEEKEKEHKLIAVDTNHFITRDLKLNATIFGYNKVVEKDGAELLITTSSGSPIVTTWRFGLGRVVAFTTDDGRDWAGQVYSRNGILISRMVNWAIGDPERNKDMRIYASDVYGGESVKVKVVSKKQPNIKIDGVEASFYLTSPNEYAVSFNVRNLGFHTVEVDGVKEIFAVNYPRELEKLGIYETLYKVVGITGGKIYDKNSDFINDVLKEAKRKSIHTTLEKRDLKLPLLAMALFLFLLEVTIRRLREVRGR